MFGVDECTCDSGSCDTCDDPVCECPLHTFEMKEEYPVSPIVLRFLALSSEEQRREIEVECLLAEQLKRRAYFYMDWAGRNGDKEQEKGMKAYVYDKCYVPQ